MISKMTSSAGAAVLLVLCSATFASAHIHHRHYYTHHVYAHRNYSPDPARETVPYQAYAGYAYGHVPYDPLIPIRPEVPPAVDPNEPGSGSYGAMLEGRNPAAGAEP